MIILAMFDIHHSHMVLVIENTGQVRF
jgi:hypothetical protein